MNREESLKAFAEIAKVIEKDSSMIIKNPILGDVVFANGTFGNLEKKNNGGFGIKHIIEGRYRKDHLSKEDISALLYLMKDVTETTFPTDISKPKINLVKNGIWVGITRNWNETDEKWIVTGYGETNQSGQMIKEATDAIKAVNAQYGYALEFLSVGKQVGAVIASINKITQNQNLSNQTQENTQNIQSISLSNETKQLFGEVVKLKAENMKLEKKVEKLTKQLNQLKKKRKSKDDNFGRS